MTRIATQACERELGDVEDELDRRQPAVEQHHESRMPSRQPSTNASRAAEDEAEDERDVAERERVRAAAEVKVDDAALGDRERDRDRPPGQVRVRERLKAMNRARVKRYGGSDQQQIQAPDGVHVAGTGQRAGQARGRLGLAFDGVLRSHRRSPTSSRRQPFA